MRGGCAARRQSRPSGGSTCRQCAKSRSAPAAPARKRPSVRARGGRRRWSAGRAAGGEGDQGAAGVGGGRAPVPTGRRLVLRRRPAQPVAPGPGTTGPLPVCLPAQGRRAVGGRGGRCGSAGRSPGALGASETSAGGMGSCPVVRGAPAAAAAAGALPARSVGAERRRRQARRRPFLRGRLGYRCLAAGDRQVRVCQEREGDVAVPGIPAPHFIFA